MRVLFSNHQVFQKLFKNFPSNPFFILHPTATLQLRGKKGGCRYSIGTVCQMSRSNGECPKTDQITRSAKDFRLRSRIVLAVRQHNGIHTVHYSPGESKTYRNLPAILHISREAKQDDGLDLRFERSRQRLDRAVHDCTSLTVRYVKWVRW